MNASRPAAPLDPAQLRQRALKALARRDLTAAELVARLSRLGREEDARDAVATLAREGLQSDARTAASRARAGRAKRRAPARIAAELARAGVAEGVARDAVDAAFSGVDPRAALGAAAQPLLKPLASRRDRERLARRLAAQGHDADDIRSALRLDEDEG